jgi:hypothetical protein
MPAWVIEFNDMWSDLVVDPIGWDRILLPDMHPSSMAIKLVPDDDELVYKVDHLSAYRDHTLDYPPAYTQGSQSNVASPKALFSTR